MDTNNGLNRHANFALMAAGAAGFVSLILVSFFIDMLTWPFIPAVMLVVFLSARSAFRRRMKGVGALTGRKILSIALEVGTLSHFYTFALYLPIAFFMDHFRGFEAELIGIYLIWTFVLSVASLVMFVWIAVPMYIGIGHLQKYMEKGVYENPTVLNETLLDDGLLRSKLDASN